MRTLNRLVFLFVAWVSAATPSLFAQIPPAPSTPSISTPPASPTAPIPVNLPVSVPEIKNDAVRVDQKGIPSNVNSTYRPAPAPSPAPPPSPLATPYTVTTVNSAGSQVPGQMPMPETNPGLNPGSSPPPSLYGDQPLFETYETHPFEPRWRADLLLGAPTGIRFQRQWGDSPLWGEIGAGSYLWWPAVFAGIRGEGRLLSGRSDVFAVRPGVDIFFLQGYTYQNYSRFDDWEYSRRVRSAGMASLDFDLSWKHRWLPSLHSELALKLGVGVAVNNRDAFILPLAAFAFGINY